MNLEVTLLCSVDPEVVEVETMQSENLLYLEKMPSCLNAKLVDGDHSLNVGKYDASVQVFSAEVHRCFICSSYFLDTQVQLI